MEGVQMGKCKEDRGLRASSTKGLDFTSQQHNKYEQLNLTHKHKDYTSWSEKFTRQRSCIKVVTAGFARFGTQKQPLKFSRSKVKRHSSNMRC
jgi:hypothetical protein